MTAPAPSRPVLTVALTRGPAVESRHALHAVVLKDGNIAETYGDPQRLTFPRSAIKPLQALALVESGAADAFGVTPAELALACASHGGEPMHTEAVAAWLQRLGLDDTALECGAHAPYANPCQRPCLLCNNCSGKHAGMLTLAKYLEVPLAGYTKVEHPVQRLILKTLSEMFDLKLTPADCGIDGCSAPNPALPLENIARGFAALLAPARFGAARAAACRRILAAMKDNPLLVGGSRRFDSAVIAETRGEIICKIGGEGVYGCVVPAMGMALALKAEDGAGRAAQAGLFLLLQKLGVFSALQQQSRIGAEVEKTLEAFALPDQKNWRGMIVGTLTGA